MQSLLQETSQVVYNYCYSFREDSPFTKGLNYYCKEVGFSNSENMATYKEWLPSVSKAYLMGDFNDFNKTSHELLPIEAEEGMFELEFNATALSEGSRLILRIIDHQGTEYNMIPPSSIVTNGNYGVYLKYRKTPLAENPIRPQELLSYNVDIQEISWEKLL